MIRRLHDCSMAEAMREMGDSYFYVPRHGCIEVYLDVYEYIDDLRKKTDLAENQLSLTFGG